jgi:hypothetical protein
VSVPPFSGSEEEFFDLLWPFLDGETDEATARQLCHKLLQEFDKIKKVHICHDLLFRFSQTKLSLAALRVSLRNHGVLK